jgi:hypothetical protein
VFRIHQPIFASHGFIYVTFFIVHVQLHDINIKHLEKFPNVFEAPYSYEYLPHKQVILHLLPQNGRDFMHV